VRQSPPKRTAILCAVVLATCTALSATAFPAFAADHVAASSPGQQDVIKVSVPKSETAYLGVKVAVQPTATDSDKELKKFTWTASALPQGLVLGKSTGAISGRPVKDGTTKTTLTARDAAGAVGSAVITWKVGRPVDIVDLSPGLKSTAVGKGLPIRFRMKDAVAHDKQELWATGLPPGLYLSTRPFMLWGWPTKAGTYAVTIHELGSLGTIDATQISLKVRAATGAGPTGNIHLVLDGTCLQAPEGSKVEIGSCASGSTEDWTIATDGTIRARGDCLDVSGSSGYSGKTVQLSSCNGSVREQWRQRSRGLIENSTSGLCLADPGTSTRSGTVPNLEECRAKAYQQWTMPAQTILASLGGSCADDYLGRGTNDSTVDLYSCTGIAGQAWNFLQDGTIRPSRYGSVCLTVHGALGEAGQKVTLWSCQENDAHQRWTISHETGFSSEIALDGACLASPSLAAQKGESLVTAKCAATNPLTLWHVQ
jgi:Ricin-type beta-trefoil lectin domain/Putative Ig domain